MATQSPAYEVTIRWTPNDVLYLCPDLTEEDAQAFLCDLELRPMDGGSEHGLTLLETILHYHGYWVAPRYMTASS